MENKIIVFYSLEGNTKFLAENLKTIIKGDILELVPKKKVETNELTKFFWGETQTLLPKKPKLKDYDIDLEKYDTIIFATPVWVSTYAPPIRTFIDSENIKDKKIGFICCHEGAKGTIFRKFKNILHGNKFIGEIDFKKVLENKKDSLEKLDRWAKKVGL
ncbi:MAG: flavodoxin family protein [Fusobacteriota bacterium]